MELNERIIMLKRNIKRHFQAVKADNHLATIECVFLHAVKLIISQCPWEPYYFCHLDLTNIVQLDKFRYIFYKFFFLLNRQLVQCRPYLHS